MKADGRVERRTFVCTLAPEPARRCQVDGRRGGVAVGQSFVGVEPVVGGDRDEQTQEGRACARRRGRRQRTVRRYTTHDVIDDVSTH